MARQQEDRFNRLAPTAPTASGMREDNSESTRSSSRSTKRSYDFMSKFSAELPPSVVATVGQEQREAIPLPSSYQVSDFDVVCGRGRAHVKRPGNQRFRKIVESHANAYEQATSKIAKTSVLCNIVEEVMAGDKIIPGRFVKEVDGNWMELPPVAAREKAGHAIRDVLVLQQGATQEQERKKLYKRQARNLSGELKPNSVHQPQEQEKAPLDTVAMLNKSWPTFGGMTNDTNLGMTVERGFQSEPNLFANEDLSIFASKQAFPEEQPVSLKNDGMDLSPNPLAPNTRLEPFLAPGSNSFLFSTRPFSSPAEEELHQFVDRHHPAPHAATSSSHFGGDDLRSLFSGRRSAPQESSEQLRSQQSSNVARAVNREEQQQQPAEDFEEEDELFGRNFFSLFDENRS